MTTTESSRQEKQQISAGEFAIANHELKSVSTFLYAMNPGG
jgi:hypothetical protein